MLVELELEEGGRGGIEVVRMAFRRERDRVGQIPAERLLIEGVLSDC